MTPERWQQVKAVFQQALERDPNERTAFLAQACGSDDALRSEVTLLLDGHAQAESFIETPAHEVAADFIAAQTSLVGQQLGHYKILALLGQGGMGEVYQARDTKLDRTVALKILPSAVAADKERMQRFHREAKAASALNHPHVATIYEIGEVENIRFIAMEYVAGQTLAAKINGQPLLLKEIIVIGCQMADALDEAHRNGITHRDIKPANVMLTPNGQVKVLDFGLAKFARPPSIDSNLSTLAKTASGVVMGTVPYMSPEQALGREVDHRSDIFSLGVVLYELATGRLPFAGANTVETLDRILHAEPEAMARFNHDVPAELERIVSKALHKEREARYQSASELLNDLSELQAVPMKRAQAKRPAPRWLRSLLRQRKVWLAAAVLLVLAASLVWLSQRPPSPPKAAGYTQLTRDGHRKSGIEYLPINSLFTDGARLYVTELLNGQYRFAQVAEAGGEVVPVSLPLGFPVLDLAPNRAELLVAKGTVGTLEWPLWIVPMLGGSPRRLGDIMAQGAAWSPDGSQIVYAKGGDLYLCRNDGTGVRKLATVPGVEWQDGVWSLRWSPDGSRIRFSLLKFTRAKSTLWEVQADGSDLHPLLPDTFDDACCGNWTPDGKYYLFEATRNQQKDIWALREPAGRPDQVQPIQLTAGPLRFLHPVASVDGRKIFVIGEQQRGELARYDVRAQRFENYPLNVSAEHLDFSRDGQWVSYRTYPEGDLWRSRVDGSERLQLTFPPMTAYLPRWSPDGKQLAFVARSPGKTFKMYLVSADGGNPEQLTPDNRLELNPGWSSDGKTLVFDSEGATYLLDLSTRRVSKLPEGDGKVSPRWSSDGRYIVTMGSNDHKLFLFDFSTGKWTELVSQNVAWPHFSQDSKYLYFASGGLWRLRIADRRLERIGEVKGIKMVFGAVGGWWGWTPDDSPLMLRDAGIQDIYALEWNAP